MTVRRRMAMKRVSFTSAFIALSCCVASAAHGQWRAPRTEHGSPDLQGNWTNATLTPFERPNEFGDRLVMTEAEVRAIEQRDAAYLADGDKPTDPNARMRGRSNDGPEGRSLGERCILSFGSSAGPPMVPLLYNNNYQIVQTKDAVMILVEMVHDARIVRIGDSHRPDSVRTWMGDSIGRWEGDTLLIETTNFRTDQGFRGASERRKVIERLTRVSARQILYQFRIEDPDSYAQPWGGEVAFNATRDNLYEYACHEGNYALPGILAGEREAERASDARGQ